MTLELVGVSRLEENIYRALLPRPRADVAEIARNLGVAPGKVRQALSELETKGLVSRTPGSRPSYIAARPELALEALVLRRIADLEQVLREASRLGERFEATSVDHPGPAAVELVRGFDATLQWAMQVQRSASREVRVIDVPPPLVPPLGPNPTELELLGRGFVYRVLYHETSFEVPGKLDAARACIEAGEQARIYSGEPIKLLIADRKLALAYDAKLGRVQDSLIVHPSFLLDALVMLFDLLWAQSVPLHVDGIPGVPGEDIALSGLDRQLLGLLAAGAKDERIARQLGIGLRTVRRRTAHLMTVLGARTRFQAGMKAAKLDLL